MSDMTNYDGRLEAMANYCEAMYLNMAKVENAYHDTEENAYAKSLPDKYLDFIGMKKLGGRTIVWNQLYGRTSNHSGKGVSVSIVNGYATFSGEANESGNAFAITWSDFKAVAGHKYLWRTTIQLPTGCWFSDQYNDAFNVSIIDKIFTASAAFSALQLWIGGTAIGADFTNVKGYLMFYDLTQMFGAGNEPSTVEEFQQMFPAAFYPPSASTLLSAGVTEVVSKDSGDNVLQTISIPSEITTMEGYGWSCPGAYNYIDFENNKFVYAVGTRAYEAGDESDSTVITDGTDTHYELDEPLEFDISDYLTDTELDVEADGSITFENQLGNDYCIPVPVQMEYIGV